MGEEAGAGVGEEAGAGVGEEAGAVEGIGAIGVGAALGEVGAAFLVGELVGVLVLWRAAVGASGVGALVGAL